MHIIKLYQTKQNKQTKQKNISPKIARSTHAIVTRRKQHKTNETNGQQKEKAPNHDWSRLCQPTKKRQSLSKEKTHKMSMLGVCVCTSHCNRCTIKTMIQSIVNLSCFWQCYLNIGHFECMCI